MTDRLGRLLLVILEAARLRADDEKGWRATFYTREMEHFVGECHSVSARACQGRLELFLPLQNFLPNGLR